MRKIAFIFIIFSWLVPFLNADELYTVKKGDTLWDICDRYYQNPFLWPKLWQINPQLTNPHWIYPGDVLCLKETPEALIKAAKKEKKIRIVKKPELKIDWRYLEAAGYLLPYKDKPLGEILKAVGEEKTILGQGDKIFVKFYAKTPEIGTTWSIFRISPPVKHPVTKTVVGYIHEILGVVKITKVYPKLAEAKIIRSYDVIYTGDYLKYYEKMQPFSIIKEKPEKIKAVIVASRNLVTEIAWPEVVYIDAGKRQGLRPGHLLEIFRLKGDFPQLPLGKILIIRTTEHTATAIVLKSKYPFHTGDIVTALK